MLLGNIQGKACNWFFHYYGETLLAFSGTAHEHDVLDLLFEAEQGEFWVVFFFFVEVLILFKNMLTKVAVNIVLAFVFSLL